MQVMNRKEFAKNFLTIGITLPFSTAIFEDSILSSQYEKYKLPFDGIMAIDAHAHPYARNLSTSSTVEHMKEAGLVASVFASVGDRYVFNQGSSAGSFGDTFDQLKRIKKYEDRKKLRLIKSNYDLNFSDKKDELFGAILAIEGGDALEGDITALDKFFDYGVRLITLVHKNNNEIGFNQESKLDGPISPFGIKVVEKMNEMGMIVDVSHSKTKTLKGIAEVTQLPLLDSHTAPFPDGENNNFPNRARSWEEMELIAKSGGVVCTMPIGYTLGNYSRTTLESWAKEIVLMKSRLGIEHVGLGTDNGLPQLVDGWESISSLPRFLNELLSDGLSKEDIIAFTGGNFLRIARACMR